MVEFFPRYLSTFGSFLDPLSPNPPRKSDLGLIHEGLNKNNYSTAVANEGELGFLVVPLAGRWGNQGADGTDSAVIAARKV